MGRKKIEIDYIPNKKRRNNTFSKRSQGLLRKADELSILCGTNITLIFTDTYNHIHYYTNNRHVRIKLNKQFNKKEEDFKVFTYNPTDYPFEKDKIAHKMSSIYSGLTQDINKKLKKREWAELKSLNRDYAEAISRSRQKEIIAHLAKPKNVDSFLPETSQHSACLTIPSSQKMFNFLTQYETEEPESLQFETDLRKIKGVIGNEKTPDLEMTDEVSQSLAQFNRKIDSHILKGHVDHFVGLVTFKILINLYFEDNIKSPKYAVNYLRKIPLSQIMLLINSKESGFICSSSIPDLIDFSDNTDNKSQRSSFSFESFSVTSVFSDKGDFMVPSPGNERSYINKIMGAFFSSQHSDIEEEFTKKVYVLNNILLSVIIQDIIPTETFSFQEEVKKVKIPSRYYALKQQYVQLYLNLCATVHQMKTNLTKKKSKEDNASSSVVDTLRKIDRKTWTTTAWVMLRQKILELGIWSVSKGMIQNRLKEQIEKMT